MAVPNQFDRLPVPDWGLGCEHCGTALAGMPEHRCSQCGEPFNVRQLVGRMRPIPDLGLHCPECGYALQGLSRERCPECGETFSVRDMLEESFVPDHPIEEDTSQPGDHHLRRRDPVFDGRERPLPDFGLLCAECDAPLTGAQDDACPQCDAPFDLQALITGGDWVVIDDYVPEEIASMAQGLLYGAQVPYVEDNARLNALYSGLSPFVPTRLRVPRAFFFDALHVLAEANQPSTVEAHGEWVCPACGEDVPAGFEVCWSCGRAHPEVAEHHESSDHE
jgi:rubrerythrin